MNVLWVVSGICLRRPVDAWLRSQAETGARGEQKFGVGDLATEGWLAIDSD
jgi:hypothetical protein